MGALLLYKAIAKSMLGRYALYAASLLSMMILARLFTPELFGTVAAIQVFFLFFQIMTEAGLGPAIINVEKLKVDDRNGLFGLTVFVGVVIAIIFYLLAPIFSAFYQIDRVDEVVMFVAPALLFFSATIIPSAFLQREQAFFRIANGVFRLSLICFVYVRLISSYRPSAIGLLNALGELNLE